MTELAKETGQTGTALRLTLDCTVLHSLSQRENSPHLLRPAPLLARHTPFITTQVCTKKSRKARRREGEKCVPFPGFLGERDFPRA